MERRSSATALVRSITLRLPSLSRRPQTFQTLTPKCRASKSFVCARVSFADLRLATRLCRQRLPLWQCAHPNRSHARHRRLPLRLPLYHGPSQSSRLLPPLLVISRRHSSRRRPGRPLAPQCPPHPQHPSPSMIYSHALHQYRRYRQQRRSRLVLVRARTRREGAVTVALALSVRARARTTEGAATPVLALVGRHFETRCSAIFRLRARAPPLGSTCSSSCTALASTTTSSTKHSRRGTAPKASVAATTSSVSSSSTSRGRSLGRGYPSLTWRCDPWNGTPSCIRQREAARLSVSRPMASRRSALLPAQR